MGHLIVSLGLLLGIAAILTLIMHKLRQPAILAFLITGVLAGQFQHYLHFPAELMDSFTEVGIIMLLFLAGLEVDLQKFRQHLKSVLINGVGQIALNTVIGFLLAWYFLGVKTPGAAIFFGLCLTFSSTIIVMGALKARKETKSLHGQVILGLMVLQDITAVLSLSVLKSMQSGGPMAPALLFLFIKLLGVALLLVVLSQTVLPKIFHWAAKESEMLVLTSLGYAFGIAAFCEAIHFSPEIGAFFAGMSLAIMPDRSRLIRNSSSTRPLGTNPFRLEIEDGVEALKIFGVILFFISLGFRLDFSNLSQVLLPVLLCSVVVFLGTPLLMLLLGTIAGLHSKPAFYTGCIINQISEFSLILATLCLGAGIFDSRIFTVITLSCIVTIILSSGGHRFIEKLYGIISKSLKFMDRRSMVVGNVKQDELSDHIVLLDYNEIAEAIAEYYAEQDKNVYILVLDPDVRNFLLEQYENTHVIPVYADMADHDVWDYMHLDKASLIISCAAGEQAAELGIIDWLAKRGADVPFLAVTDSRREAKELYVAGARYVIQTDDLAAKQLMILMKAEIIKGTEAFKGAGKEHFEQLKEINDLWIYG